MTRPNERPRGATHPTAREARARRSFDGVLASYVRELAAAADTTPRSAGRRSASPTEDGSDGLKLAA
jgi:hypothetical protein